MNDGLKRTAQEVLDRHPAPALPLHELHTLVARERSGIAPRVEQLVRSLRPRSTGIRLVETDPLRLAKVAPRGWAVAPPGRQRGGVSHRSVNGKLRESVRALGEALEPGSNIALARWARLLHEERRARRALARRSSSRCRPG